MEMLLANLIVPAITTGCVYALIALGFNIVDRTTKLLNFAHGDIVMWAPMGALVAHRLWGIPAVPALGAGVLFAVGFSLLVERAALRHFVGKGNSFGWILSGLGASLILQQLAAEPFRGPQSFPMSLSLSPLVLGPVRLSPQSLLLIGGTLLTYAVVIWFYRSTLTGRKLVAMGQDREGAEMIGISVASTSRVAMVIAGLTASVAGFIVAPLFLVSPQLGFPLTFIGFVAVTLGGLGSIGGGLIGGLIVGTVIQLVATYSAAVWTNTALFAVLLVVYLIKPYGLFGHAPPRNV